MEFKEYYKDKGVAEEYDTRRLRGLKAIIVRQLEFFAVDSLIEKSLNSKILEVGVGTGFIAKLLAKKGRLTGVDISPEMLKLASKTVGDAKFLLADVLNLKLGEKFDTAVSIRVISHFSKKDATRALKNINLNLKEKGVLVFNLENKSWLRRFLRRLRNWGSTYNYQYSKSEVEEIVRNSGYKIKRIIYVDHFFILPLHILNNLLFKKLDNFIFKIEKRLSNIRFASNNSFIRCEK
jgi:ubiquinone/menaquinone biosynthesis C-methylase UbiE